jgi:hypothetical protein
MASLRKKKKKHSTSFIITNLKLIFEPYVLNRFGSDLQLIQKRDITI